MGGESKKAPMELEPKFIMNNSIVAQNVDQDTSPERYHLLQCNNCRKLLVSASLPPDDHLCRNFKYDQFLLGQGKLKLLAESTDLESLLQWQTSVAQGVDSDFKGV
jgi:hypothetical protein